jgi:hypothetical protein
MTTFNKAALLGTQAGKAILTGTMRAQEYVHHLRNKELTVNSKAQRSLVPGANKETTSDLIDNDGVLKMQRMKSFLKFVRRVIDNVERGNVTEGFFGSVSFVLPEQFTRARFEPLRIDGVPDDVRVGMLKANPRMGESILHIADGQARAASSASTPSSGSWF